MSSNLSSRLQKVAIFELVIAAALWGFGFIAAKWSLVAAGAIAISFLRFVIAVAAGGLTLLGRRRFKTLLDLELWRATFIPGMVLALALVVQTWSMKYTTATKCGFITTLYALFVPFWEAFFLGGKILKRHWTAIGLAIFGVALIANIQAGEMLDLSFGDFLAFLGAILASGQIAYMGHLAPKVKDPFVFNLGQVGWAMVLPFATMFFFEPMPQWSQLLAFDLPLAGVLFLAFGSTLLALHLQISSQRYISSTLAGLLCLLEAPFAAGLAVWILHESMKPLQWAGAGLVFAGVVLAATAPHKSADAQRVSPVPNA